MRKINLDAVYKNRLDEGIRLAYRKRTQTKP